MPNRGLLATASRHLFSPASWQEQAAKAASKVRGAQLSLTRGDFSDMRVFADRLSRDLRLKSVSSPLREATKRAIEIIAEHLADGEHDQVTERLLKHVKEARALHILGHNRLFTLTRAARSAGLFVASGPIEDAAIRAFGLHAQSSRGIRGHLMRLRFALESGDIDQALQIAAPIQQHHLHSVAPEIRTALSFLSLMAPDSALGSPPPQVGVDPFEDYVLGQNVIVYGPGPTDAALPIGSRGLPVARVLMPGVTSWDNHADVADGRVDVQYANGETQSWLAGLSPSELHRIVEAVRFTTLKFDDNRAAALRSSHAGIRSASRRPQFIDGSPNMVPIMLWDLLSSGAQSVFATGTSFFLGSQPYRADHLRYDASIASRTDLFGSRGQEFDRCYSIAKHNPLANRRFVKNLLSSLRVQGDSHFQRAVGLSDNAYLAELDALYGSVRR